MIKLNKHLPVTTGLRLVLKELGLMIEGSVYSDRRKNGQAVGVKVVGLKLYSYEERKIKEKMEELGYTYHYIRFNNKCNWSKGTRFCFSA